MPRKKKVRVEIPSYLAAKVLFSADRTCCVCRVRGKPVQIHHMDDDPSNNEFANLAVLCFDCHRDTQIRGGFDRKLDVDQVSLYRSDWLRTVELRRLAGLDEAQERQNYRHMPLKLATSLAELYREDEDYIDLAFHYNGIGNSELRDKYIEEALRRDHTESEEFLLRRLQGRLDLLTPKVVQRALDEAAEDWTSHSTFLLDLGRTREGVNEMLDGIKEVLEAGNWFTTAFYLKYGLDEVVVNSLFEQALKEATEADDLWWQVRPLQELGWFEELRSLLLRNENRIMESDNLRLMLLLAEAKGDEEKIFELEKSIASEEASLRRSLTKEQEEIAGQIDAAEV